MNGRTVTITTQGGSTLTASFKIKKKSLKMIATDDSKTESGADHFAA